MTQIVENERDHRKEARMARLYINEARATRWPHWRKTLLGYAANRRALYFELVRKKKPEIGQLLLKF